MRAGEHWAAGWENGGEYMRKDAVWESDNRGNFRPRWSDYESHDVNAVFSSTLRDFVNQKKKSMQKKEDKSNIDFNVAAEILKTNLCRV